jgi:acetolactate synthase I/II/III large subunit
MSTVAEAVGTALARLGIDLVFGVVGSGNFHVTNALVAGGARYVAARHECGAATMADAYARTSRRVGALSVHQGCGLTNAITGIAEAAKSRTPMLVLAAETGSSAVRSNFRIDQTALVTSVGAVAERIHSPQTAVADAARAYRTAADQRRTVVLNLPLDLQAAPCPPDAMALPPAPELRPPVAAPHAVAELASVLADARRPVFIAGRGARVAAARAPLERLADQVGALLATSAVAKGLFNGNPWYLDVSGGFASPLAAELIQHADVIVGWGCALNMWTMRHGALIGPGATVVQVDLDAEAIGANRPVDLGVLGDVALTATAVADELARRRRQSVSAVAGESAGAVTGESAAASAGESAGASAGESAGAVTGESAGASAGESAGPGGDAAGYRSGELKARIAAEHRWRDVPYDDESDGTRIDPRTVSIMLDDLLPPERTLAIDSGNFMGYPSMYLSVPDDDGFCFTQAFQSIGLGLATAIGAALARPDRLPVAALGDGGALMSIADLDTAVRLQLPLVIIIYDDEAYGAEVHHFGPHGHALDTVVFPPTDIAEVARGFGCDGVVVRTPDDLKPVTDWLNGARSRPLLIDAKVVATHGSWWLEEAFRGH